MKKYTIVSFVLLASFFGTPLFAGESSGSGASSSSGAVSSGMFADTVRTLNAAVSLFIEHMRILYEELQVAQSSDQKCIDFAEQLVAIEKFLTCVDKVSERTEYRLVHNLRAIKVLAEFFREPYIKNKKNLIADDIGAKVLQEGFVKICGMAMVLAFDVRSLLSSVASVRTKVRTLDLEMIEKPEGLDMFRIVINVLGACFRKGFLTE